MKWNFTLSFWGSQPFCFGYLSLSPFLLPIQFADDDALNSFVMMTHFLKKIARSIYQLASLFNSYEWKGWPPKMAVSGLYWEIEWTSRWKRPFIREGREFDHQQYCGLWGPKNGIELKAIIISPRFLSGANMMSLSRKPRNALFCPSVLKGEGD